MQVATFVKFVRVLDNLINQKFTARNNRPVYFSDKIKKLTEEVGELIKAEAGKGNTGDPHFDTLMEGWDIIVTTISCLVNRGYSDEDIMKGFQNLVDKLSDRWLIPQNSGDHSI